MIDEAGSLGNSEIISDLQSSNLVAECSHCSKEFLLSKAILFDGLGKFPDIAEQKRKQVLEELKERFDDLKKRKMSAAGAEKKAVEVGVGKIIEKVLPAYRDFKLPLSDCRPLFEPVDLIVFNGASRMQVDSITFLEIKTGESRLNKHQKVIRNAIEDKKLKYEEV